MIRLCVPSFGITSGNDMTELPDHSPHTCPPATGRGLRSRGGRVAVPELVARRPRPDAAGRDHVLKELCGTAAGPDELNRHTIRHSTPLVEGSPLKNGKPPSQKRVTDFNDTGVDQSPGNGETDGRKGRIGKRGPTSSGRGRGRRITPDMSLVRSSSRKKFKKSLGPDFLDPTELNSQMKHKIPDSLKAVADTDKVYSDDGTIQCSQCNHKVATDMDEVFPDSLSQSVKWICSTCRTDSSPCCFCGDGEAEFLCPSCEPGVSRSFHRKCIPDYKPGSWKCRQCEEAGQIGESRAEEGTVPDDLPVPRLVVGTSDSLVEETSPTDCSTGIQSLPETAKVTKVVPVVPQAASDESEERGPLRNRKPETWSVADVASFIESAGFGNEAATFKDQEIDGKSLLLMKRSDVITGLNLKVGPALKIFSFINHLQIFKLVAKESHEP